MRHSRWMRYERFDTSETFAQGAQLDTLQYFFCVVQRTGLERNHTAKTSLLSLREFVLRMGREAGIVNLLNFRMLGEEVRNYSSILVMSIHPHRKGFRSAQH